MAFDWDASTGEITPAGVAANLSTVDWITYSPGREFIYAAAELDSFNGKPTGAVASFGVHHGKLTQLSAQNSASKGTCHVALDHTGRVLLAADYGGGSAASLLVTDGKLSSLVWSEHYRAHGPDADRQEAAHAHFASFSPDNRFAYINDLGGDSIHIYKLNAATAELTPAGTYHSAPGAGPRTLHFHPNGKFAYCMNELNSSVDVLGWNPNDRALSPVQNVKLLPEDGDKKVVNTGCDTVLTRDGKFAYFANRGNDFLMAFTIDEKTGKLTQLGATPRIPSGGKTPRNFRLDPTEQWMVVANQGSGNLSVFARNAKTGELAAEGKNFPCPTPMCVVFV